MTHAPAPTRPRRRPPLWRRLSGMAGRAFAAGAMAASFLVVAPPPAVGAPAGAPLAAPAVIAAEPTPQIAAALFARAEGSPPVTLTREDTPVPLWRAEAGDSPLGVIGSTWELAGSTGYSGRPIDILVAVGPGGVVAGAQLMAQQEPVLTLGISQDDIARYVAAFRGYDAAAPVPADTLSAGSGLPDVISRATISTGVIRDGIIRSARVLASAAQPAQGGIDRVGFRPLDWPGLVDMGGLVHAEASMADAARVLAGAKQVPQASDRPFISLWTGLADPPMVGRNLLGQRAYTAAIAAAAPGEVLLAVLSSGVQGHRGTGWKDSGRFDRITVRQGDLTLTPSAEGYTPIGRIEAPGAPEFRERSLFRLPADPATGGIDPLQPFTVTVTGTRPAAAGGDELSLGVTAEVRLPDALRLAPAAAPTAAAPGAAAEAPQAAGPDMPPPLWQEFWRIKRPQIAVVGAMLAVLGLILFGQEWLVARRRLWRRVRLAYLATTLVVLGWGIGGQLSIVQLIAFLQALLTGFRWETFLIAPVIFVLWSAVALGMLFWGRGVF